ncbi:MAG: aspartate-semialdehyde dehydrogenase [Candidatus Omnitrophota bacterium]|nr:MAG: aspartate-semialdehyde dehydrogenase [Candidatus Omnitrophota bacterium]
MLKKKDKYNIAIIGATGAVGGQFLSILEERDFPVKELKLLASERSKGKKLKFKGKLYPVEILSHRSFKAIDIVLSSAGASRSLQFLPSAVKAGAVCIDNSSAFRMEKDVPLVVPEVNPHQIENHKGIIANPNCSTIQAVVALWPLHKVAKIKRIVASTYQSVSGAGQQKILELEKQTEVIDKIVDNWIVGSHSVDKFLIKQFPYQIAFNLIPQIDGFLDNAYTKEEMKLVNETRKIMQDDSIGITSTCIRVPVYFAHSESINIETEKKLSAEEARKILSKAPGVIVIDDTKRGKYPMPLNAEGKNEVFVGRIREDESIENGLNLWVVSDNLRKGAALNAIQIAEVLIKHA